MVRPQPRDILFTDFQAATARALDLPVVLMAAAQGVGAAIGNAIAPHNIIAGAATVGLSGRDGEVLARTLISFDLHRMCRNHCVHRLTLVLTFFGTDDLQTAITEAWPVARDVQTPQKAPVLPHREVDTSSHLAICPYLRHAKVEVGSSAS